MLIHTLSPWGPYESGESNANIGSVRPMLDCQGTLSIGPFRRLSFHRLKTRRSVSFHFPDFSAEKLSSIVIRRCPRCLRGLTKSIGCPAVSCPCGAEVCFTCGESRFPHKVLSINGAALFKTNIRIQPHVSCANTLLRSDKAKVKELYEASTAVEQRFIRALYPDVEQFKSLKHWLLDKANEKAVWYRDPIHVLEAALVFTIMFVVIALAEAFVRPHSDIALPRCAMGAMFCVACYIIF